MSGYLRALDIGYWSIDNDYGEMFSNYWLHPELRKYSGVDLTPIYGPNSDGSLRVEAWTRLPQGEKPSPYLAVQQGRRLKRKCYGNRLDEGNVFRWDHVDLNLPGSKTYKPGQPWFSKRRRTGEIAADVFDYVDDDRGTGPTAEDAWQVGSTIGKTCSFYGNQDAIRKRQP